MKNVERKGIFHSDDSIISKKIEGLYHIIPFKLLRNTNKVNFHTIPKMERITGIERVVHEEGALSPGSVGDTKKPWYMHTSQEDNLITLNGTRLVELYHPEFKEIATFEISPNAIKLNGEIILEGPGILGWPTGVFHRNSSPYQGGSSSLNLGVQYPEFDIDSEFNIYDVNTETGEYKVIRNGFLDQ